MAKLSRAAGWGTRAFLWLVKGTLLLMAATTLVLWPMSREQSLEVSHEQWFVEPERVDLHNFAALADHCRILIRHDHIHYLSGKYLELGRELATRATRDGSFFWTEVWQGGYGWQLENGWGPFRWYLHPVRLGDYAEDHHYFSLP